MDKFSDMALVTQVVMFRNKRAFDSLVRKYQSPIRRFFLHQTLGDAQLSDDLAQDTFIKAYTSLSQFKGLSGFSTWLYRIAYNVLYDYTRSHRLTYDVDTSEIRKRSDSVTDSGLKIDIYEGLRLLKEEERLCVTLQLIDGLQIEKISEITGLAAGTVKSHLSRGKKKLAMYLKENGYDR